MVDFHNSLNTYGVYWPFGTTLIDPVITTDVAPKVEENPKELKINIKKHQIKFNFAL